MTDPVAREARPEEKSIVGITVLTPDPNKPNNKLTQVVVLLSPPAFDYMQEGRCHQVDMTKLGVPVQFIIARCDSRAHGLKMLDDANRARGIATHYDATLDLSIPEGK